MSFGSDSPVFKPCPYYLVGEWRSFRFLFRERVNGSYIEAIGNDWRKQEVECTGLTKNQLSVNVYPFLFFFSI